MLCAIHLFSPLLPKGSPNKLIEAVAAERRKTVTADAGGDPAAAPMFAPPPPRSVNINMAGGYEEVGDDEYGNFDMCLSFGIFYFTGFTGCI